MKRYVNCSESDYVGGRKMKIVIDIPKELYNYMQTEEYDRHLDKRFDYQIRFAVKDGIPLPQGHGRLIDADALLEHTDGGDWNGVGYDAEYVKVRYIYNAPTIIEAE